MLEHLRVLLNCSEGSCSARPDLGLPDMTDHLHNFPAGAQSLQAALQGCIARNEPRLRNVTVRPVGLRPDQLILHFDVSARLAEGRSKVVRFDTHVTRGGRVRVR